MFVRTCNESVSEPGYSVTPYKSILRTLETSENPDVLLLKLTSLFLLTLVLHRYPLESMSRRTGSSEPCQVHYSTGSQFL